LSPPRRTPTSLALLALTTGLTIAVVILFGIETAKLLPSADGYTRKDGELLGGDFIAFYVGGRLYDTDREHTYDFAVQHEVRQEVLPPDLHERYLLSPFVYPPPVAAALAPLSRFDLETAYYIWGVLGLVVSAASLSYLVRVSRAWEVLPWALLVVLILAFYPYTVQTFITGQAAWIGVSVLAVSAAELLRQRPYIAGVVLSASYYKPPLFVFLVAVLLLSQGRRFVLGFLSGASGLVALTWLAVGTSGVVAYLEAGSRYVYGREVAAGHQLSPEYGKGLWALGVNFLPSTPAVLAVLAIPMVIAAVLAIRLLRSRQQPTRLYGLVFAMVCTLAFSLQVLWYDLALLLVPMMLALVWHGRSRPSLRTLILLPLLGFYLEMFVSDLSLAGRTVHASAFLFVALVCSLGWYGARRLLPADHRSGVVAKSADQ
jgi:hypothetical protein